MTEYRIRKRAPACMVSGRPFESGDVVVSAIYPDPESEGFVRRDVLESEFVADGSAFSFWKTVHEEESKEDRRVDLDLALTFLDRLLREADPAREGLVYTLTLLLSRKRRVKIKETRQLPDGELLTVLVPGAEDDQLVQVRAPVLDDEKVASLQSQLAELFDFGEESSSEPAEDA
jgi:hypothetical protein